MKTTQLSNLIAALFMATTNQLLATNVMIARYGSQVVLSWPVAGTDDFYLQAATNFSAPAVWFNGPDPATNGENLVITNEAMGASEFYRLQAWEILFDGTNTTAFRSPSSTSFPSNSWFVTNGTLATKVVANAASLMTKSTYSSFELRFGWKCETNGNSGVFYRNGAIPEYQLFDDANVTNSPYHYVNANYTNQIDLIGAVYGKIAPTNKTLVPTGQWNDCRIVVRGYHVTHSLNGRVIVDYQIDDPAYTNSFVQATNTNISFQNKGSADDGVVPGVVYFRDVKIRRLP